MRILTGDEVGLLKCVHVDSTKSENPPEQIERWGKVDRSMGIEHLSWHAGQINEHKAVTIGRSSGLIEAVQTINGTVNWRFWVNDALPSRTSTKEVVKKQLGKRAREEQHKWKTFAGVESWDDSMVAFALTRGEMYVGKLRDCVQEQLPETPSKRSFSDPLTKELDPALVHFHIPMGRLERMRVHGKDRRFLATGGWEVDLHVFDVHSTNVPESLFKAKNDKNDHLNLRAPVWITDIQYMSMDTPFMILTSTAYGQLRLYDLRTQRRPIHSKIVHEHPLRCIMTCLEKNLVSFGTSTGNVCVMDLRTWNPLGHLQGSFAGAITSLSASSSCGEDGRMVLASVCLDRFLRIHDLESRKLLRRFYLKQRMSSVLVEDSDERQVEIDNHSKSFMGTNST